MLVRPTLLPIDHWTKTDTGYATMRVTSPYADRPGGFHAALDIGNARLGDVLTAAGSGTVIATGYLSYPWSEPKPSDAQWQSWGYDMTRKPSLWEGPTWGGQMVVIRTRDYFLLYAHCRSITVRSGQTVRAFDQIGTVGESGSAYRAGHLHFGVVEATDAQIAELRNRRTPIPRSLTRDPWPLIVQTVTLPDTAVPRMEDDMRYPSPNRPFLLADIAPGNNLRSAATLKDEDVALFLKPGDKPGEFSEPIRVGVFCYVTGATWNGSDAWAWIGYDGETYLVHSKLLSNLRATDNLPVKVGGYTAEDLKEAQIIARRGAADKAEAQTVAWIATRPPIRP